MTMNSRLYLDVHVLQTLPPSCVNRDDTGSPKTAVYGGVTRARVSSQSWKKAVRELFKETVKEELLGKRTKKIVALVAEEIRQLEITEDVEKAAQKALEVAGLDIKSVENGTDALFFMSYAQAKALARLIAENEEVLTGAPSKELKAQAKEAIKQYPGLDIALFGRMVASDHSLNTDACAQVAHSISTHKTVTEYDYFTAVDDLAPEDNAGAGHIGTVEFNSSTLYRYATVAVHELKKHLDDETPMAVGSFVEAFVRSMPTGKQNTFANRTMPDAVLVTLRSDQPINMVGAFERPVQAGVNNEKGYVEPSAKALETHAQSVYQDWLGEPEVSLVAGSYLGELGEKLPFKELLKKLQQEIEVRVGNGGDGQ